MLLAIDIGNTNIVFALAKDRNVLHGWRCATVHARTEDEYASFLSPLLREQGLEWTDVTDVIISSVVPDVDFHMTRFVRTYIGKEPVYINRVIADIDVKIDTPSELGADRLVNAVAVKAFHRTPAIVIDFGTATTFDVVAEDGAYLGGVIAPGINLSLEALSRAASKLPRVRIQKPAAAIGTNTVSAMQSGVYWGYVGLIEGIAREISRELQVKPYIIATGGLAPLFAEHMDLIEEIDDTLTLKGLIHIFYNREKAQN